MSSRPTRLVAALALAAIVIATVAAFASSPVSADVDPAVEQAIADARANVVRCQAALDAGGLNATERGEALRCVHINEAALRGLLGSTTPTATAPPSTAPSSVPPTTAAPPTSLPPPTTPPVTTGPPPSSPAGQECAPWPAFPDASCTGVPAGVTLTAYTGPCTITTPNLVLDSLLITCSPLRPAAAGVLIRNSRIVGNVYGQTGAGAPGFSIVDSEVVAPQAGAVEVTGIGEANFIALRVEVTGGNRGIYCRFACTVTDSWVHGTSIAQSPRIHASGIRQSQGARLIHNRIHCSAQDTPTGGGCSADLTGYGDFEPVHSNRVERNLFVATPGGACAYGGSSGDDGTKPFGNQAHDIVFVDNVFERGTPGDGGRRNCGYYFPITDFDSSRPGNLWVNNRWDDGGVVPPAN